MFTDEAKATLGNDEKLGSKQADNGRQGNLSGDFVNAWPSYFFPPSISVTWKSSHVLLCLVEPEAGRPNVEQIKKVQQVNDWRQTERGLRSKIICTCGWTVCLSEVTGKAVIGSLLSGRKNNYSAGKSWWPCGFLLFFLICRRLVAMTKTIKCFFNGDVCLEQGPCFNLFVFLIIRVERAAHHKHFDCTNSAPEQLYCQWVTCTRDFGVCYTVSQ